MKKILAILLASTTLALAQDVPNHEILVGAGPGVVGFRSITPSTLAWCLVSNGLGADPSFQACPGASGGVISIDTKQGAITLGTGLSTSGNTLNFLVTNAVVTPGAFPNITGAGDGSVGLTVPKGATAGFSSLNTASTRKTLLALSDTSLGVDQTRLRSGGGGIAFENVSAVPFAYFDETTGTLIALSASAGTLTNPGRRIQVKDGSSSSRITAATTPTVSISRYENTTTPVGDNADNAALNVASDGISSAQTITITSRATCTISDCGAVYATSSINGAGTGSAIASFASAAAFGTNQNMSGTETNVSNETGVDRPWLQGGAMPFAWGHNIICRSTGGKVCSAAVAIRGNIDSDGGRWDVGIGILHSDGVKTAEIQSGSSSTHMWYAPNGTHTNGLKWNGSTFSGNIIDTDVFRVTGTGATTSTSTAGFATTDGAVTTQMVSSSAGGAGIFKTSSAHPILIQANSVTGITIGTSGGVTFANALSWTAPAVTTNGNRSVCYSTISNAISAFNGVCGTSDERLKTNFTNLKIADGLEALDRLHPIRFDWIDPRFGDAREIGFLAQNVQDVFPELVAENGPVEIDMPDGSKLTIPDTLSVDYPKLIVPMVLAIQQLKARVEALEGKVR